MSEIAEVSKRGEIVIQTSLRRSSHGLSVSIKTVKPVEEFIRSMGSGEDTAVKLAGRYWYSIADQPLRFYSLLNNPGIMPSDDGVYFRIDQLGYPLAEAEPDKGIHEVVNLSFLRLVGTSEGAGVTFGVRGVYSLDQLRTIRDRISSAQRKFYISYLKPVGLTVMTCTQEM